jgi:hypothetical protein
LAVGEWDVQAISRRTSVLEEIDGGTLLTRSFVFLWFLVLSPVGDSAADFQETTASGGLTVRRRLRRCRSVGMLAPAQSAFASQLRLR